MKRTQGNRTGRLAWHGRLGPDGPHAGRGRFRPDRTDVLLHFQCRRQGPGHRRRTRPTLQDAFNIDALKRCDIIITAQGGDYTTEVFPKLRAAGWTGHWIDAASTLAHGRKTR
jgi:aspartate-semialdehyde dehydrogenase